MARPGATLLGAVVEASRRAYADHVASGWTGPAPRGCDLLIRDGEATELVWSSDSHLIILRACGRTPSELGGTRVTEWQISIKVTDETRGVSRLLDPDGVVSHRILAAIWEAGENCEGAEQWQLWEHELRAQGLSMDLASDGSEYGQLRLRERTPAAEMSAQR